MEDLKKRIKILDDTIKQKKEVITDNNTIKMIYEKCKTIDLTSVPRILHYLNKIGKKDESLIISLKSLREKGGDYLKQQGAIIYYLNLLNKKYLNIKFDDKKVNIFVKMIIVLM